MSSLIDDDTPAPTMGRLRYLAQFLSADDLNSVLTLATSLLPDRGRWRNAGRAIVIGTALYRTAKKVQAVIESERRYTVSIEERDQAYDAVHGWLLTRLPSTERRSLTVHTKTIASDNTVYDKELNDWREVEPGEQLYDLWYDGTRAAVIDIGGYSVVVHLSESRVVGNGNANVKTAKMTLTASCPEGRDAILKMVDTLLQGWAAKRKNSSQLYVANTFGWQHRDLLSRPLDTVILPAEQKARILNDLKVFLGTEKTYETLGLPWHRGVLLEGPPGTGKTSLVRALATELGFDLYFLSLADVTKDIDLIKLVGQVPPRSLLLIEDIDSNRAARERVDGDHAISSTALLNTLDGVTTPHGLITFLTTNYIDNLDPTLIRGGRADLIEHIGYCTAEQASLLVDLVAGHPVPWPVGLQVPERLTPAELFQAALPCLPDRDAAAEAVLKRLHGGAGHYEAPKHRFTPIVEDYEAPKHRFTPIVEGDDDFSSVTPKPVSYANLRDF